MAGPLDGVRIIELAGLGPGPFAAMMLADHGAEVIRIDRPGVRRDRFDVMGRSRRCIGLDLKNKDGVAFLRSLVKTSDGLIEGFRPGVMERLGLGPDLLLADNPRLVYGRMTGWGQTGPYAKAAGHDINYIALSGALHAIGRAGEKPVPPLNLVGDFGGGGMMLAFGMVASLLSARSTGRGQVIDCAMVDGAALLMGLLWGMRASGAWKDERGINLLDTGAHFYDTYETADGLYVSIGSIEPQFYAELRRLAGLSDDPEFDAQTDRTRWPHLKTKLDAVFKTRTRAEWCALMEHTDVCFAPVLGWDEAPAHPHNKERGTFITVEGVQQPAPTPRYSATPLAAPAASRPIGAELESLAAEAGYDLGQFAALRKAGIIEC
jgi:alpha-methylacyl-CoA racemase